MNQDQFVDAVRLVVEKSSAEGVLRTLLKPPGRKPSKDLVSLSEWYCRQSDEDRERITEVARRVADSAVFGYHCVLDGVRKALDEDGEFTLTFKTEDGVEYKLAGEGADYLHDIHNAE